MKAVATIRIACFLAMLLGALSTLPAGLAQSPKARVGVWNIEALSTSAKRGFPELQDGNALPPRGPEELEAIAEYLKSEIKPDALMVTEIEADGDGSSESQPQSAQLDEICSHLGNNWRYFLGRTGGKMRLGLLFNADRIRLKKLVNLKADAFHVSGKDVFDRDPFIVWLDVLDGDETRNDVLLICLHLKSQQKPFRHNRMAAIAKLLGDITDKDVRQALGLPSLSEEKEVFILGDCNDASHQDSGFKYMFDYLNGVGFLHQKPASGPYPRTRFNGSQIDHIFAWKDATPSIASGSFTVHTVPNTDEENVAYRETFSDHFPVTVDVLIGPDQDMTLNAALAVGDSNERAMLLGQLADEIRERIEPKDDVEDIDEEPIVVTAEVYDDDFERILAPRVDASGAADDSPGE
jgi:hypothetical protein